MFSAVRPLEPVLRWQLGLKAGSRFDESLKCHHCNQLNWHWERILSCVKCRMFGDVTDRKGVLQAILRFQAGILRQKFAGKD
jgi:hypothetical protein